jgi:sulfate adenylyltransferase subunit 2
MKTQALKQALDAGRFDAAFGGARRDEEKSRAKERVFSFRDRQPPLGPEEPAPRAVEALQRAGHPQGRVDPGVPAVELDRARHLAVHLARGHPDRAAVLLRPAPVVERDGVLIMVDDDRFRFAPGRGSRRSGGPVPHARLLPAVGRGRVRRATTLPEIIQEMLLATRSEREGRVIDYDQSGSMEEKKREGYF